MRFGKGKQATVAVIAVITLFCVLGAGKIWETNDAGMISIRQLPYFGTMYTQSTEGTFVQAFGNVWKYKHAGTYTFGGHNTDDSISTDPIEVQYADAGKAKLSGNARFDLPLEHGAILVIHRKFRSFESISKNLVRPAIKESLIVTASLMTSEESYSGRRAEFAQLARDQVKYGIYLTDSKDIDIMEEGPVDPDTKKVTMVKTRKRVVNIRRDPKTGEPMRRENPLEDYQIEISQFYLDEVPDYEEGIDIQIADQRNARMKTITAKANAEKAVQDTKTAIERGKLDVATAEYAALKIKKEKEVNAEREKQVAITHGEKERDVAALKKAAAAEYKQEQILRGQGEAERKRLVMAADGALDKKLTAMVQIAEVNAEALAKRNVPGTIFGAPQASASAQGQDQETVDFLRMLNIRAAQDLGLSLKVPAGNTAKKGN